ncbi:MAG: hypothetical protein JO011_06520 [Ktedonobacteraceae bacterium]|nr:hypothetical protein [Ktedonobacteraceae bacterium]MBV9710549.1 hypothetical protein [Ktedonobacteraceae bacterium]
MVTLVLIVIIFILLDVTAIHWGYDSRDDINSPEWTRRQDWLFSHLTQQD